MNISVWLRAGPLRKINVAKVGTQAGPQGKEMLGTHNDQSPSIYHLLISSLLRAPLRQIGDSGETVTQPRVACSHPKPGLGVGTSTSSQFGQFQDPAVPACQPGIPERQEAYSSREGLLL